MATSNQQQQLLLQNTRLPSVSFQHPHNLSQQQRNRTNFFPENVIPDDPFYGPRDITTPNLSIWLVQDQSLITQREAKYNVLEVYRT